MGAEKKKNIKEKPIDKMTVGSIKKARGIEDTPKKKGDASVRDIKLKIRKLKAETEAFLKADNKKMAIIFRRRISRLKKKTRKAA